MTSSNIDNNIPYNSYHLKPFEDFFDEFWNSRSGKVESWGVGLMFRLCLTPLIIDEYLPLYIYYLKIN